MSALIPCSREEAIAKGMSYWIVPETKAPRSLDEVDREIAEYAKEAQEREDRARAIERGYEPPLPGDMFLVRPGCSRGCKECSFACATYIDFVPRMWAGLEELRAEREEIVRTLRAGENVVRLPRRAPQANRQVRHG